MVREVWEGNSVRLNSRPIRAMGRLIQCWIKTFLQANRVSGLTGISLNPKPQTKLETKSACRGQAYGPASSNRAMGGHTWAEKRLELWVHRICILRQGTAHALAHSRPIRVGYKKQTVESVVTTWKTTCTLVLVGIGRLFRALFSSTDLIW